MNRQRTPINGSWSSRYVYDRSLQADVARTLAQCRARTCTGDQLRTLDIVIEMLMDTFSEFDASFDADNFATQARYMRV